jgi:hypothetical protein
VVSAQVSVSGWPWNRWAKQGRHPVRYLQLTHNEWDPATMTSRPKMLHSFGREDQLDRDAIKTAGGVADPAAQPTALTSTPAGGPAELALTSSRPVGGTLVLDTLWHRLGIDTVMTRLLTGRKRDPRTERVLFALVANRVFEPGFEAGRRRMGHPARAHRRPGRDQRQPVLPGDGLAARHRPGPGAGGVLAGSPPCLITRSTLLFFDTTSTYFETDEPDAPVARDTHGRPVPDPPSGSDETPDSTSDVGTTDVAADGVGFRTYGKSKDSRDDLPQVVIGMAVTRAGIPVRVWCWPRNTSDSALITDTDRLTPTKRAELRGRISTMPGLNLRLVYPRIADRIRANVILCWLALLLVRIVETSGASAAELNPDF